MKDYRKAFAVAAALLSYATYVPRSDALTIETEFLGGTPQDRAVGGGDLSTIFEAAASVWERAILDDFTVHLSYGWARVGGAEHWLMDQGGTPHRETAGQILFNNDDIDGHFVWFMDPDPLSNSAYGEMTEMTADFGGGQINVGRVFTNFSANVGSDVLACYQCSDLFTTALHEIGHSLGMSAANTSFIEEAADGFVDIGEASPFAGTRLQLVSNPYGPVAHFDNGDVLPGTVMGGIAGYGLRAYLSDADILAIGRLSDFQHINLDPMTRVDVAEPGTLVLFGAALLLLLRRVKPKIIV